MVSFFGKSSAASDPAAGASSATVGWRERLKAGLGRVSGALGEALGSVVHGRRAISAEVYDELETALLAADVGIADSWPNQSSKRETASNTRRYPLRPSKPAILARSSV
jgi:signal recognition particle GTPase